MNARQTIDKVGLAAASSAKSLQTSGVAAAKWTAIMTGAGTAAVGAAGLIGVGLVGAIGGVGIAAAAQAPKVKKAFSSLSEEVKKSMVSMSAPIQNVLVGLAGDMKDMFSELKPEIGNLFKAVAPLVDVLGRGLTTAFGDVVHAMGSLVQFAAPLVKVFAEELGPTINSLMTALGSILGPASGAGAAFKGFFQILQTLLPFVGDIIGMFVQLGATVIPVLLPVLTKLVSILDTGLAQALPDIGRALVALLPALGTLFGAIAKAVLALSPILPPLAKAFASVFNAIAPLIPQIVSHLTPLIVGLIPPFAALVKALVPVIPPLLKILGAFLPLAPLLANVAVTVVKALLPALIPFLNIVAQLATKFAGALMTAIVQSIPSLVTLAKSFGQILTAITPLLPVLVNVVIAFTPIIPLFAKLAATASKILVPAIQGIAVVAAVVAHGVANAFKMMADIVLSVIIGILGAASHLPFVGKKFGEAQKAVKEFKTSVDSDLENVIISTARAQREAINNIGKIAPGLAGQRPKVRTAAQQLASEMKIALGSIPHKVDVLVQAHLQSFLAKGNAMNARDAVGGQRGMRIPGYGGGDIQPAMLEPGEAVIPKHLVGEIAPWASAKGIPGFAAGGLIGRYIYDEIGRPPSVGAMSTSIANSAAANMGSLLGGLAAGGGLGGAIGVQRWAGTFLAALALAGESSSWLGLGLRRLAQESGGNPMAINLTDSNARAGDPSRGLMQTIGSTFAAYAGPLRGRGIYDPLANIYAAIRYTRANYGTLAAWGRPGGYAAGLDYVPYDGFRATLHRGERVVPAGAAGGTTIIVNTGAVITERQLGDIVRDAIRRVSTSNGGRTGI